MQTINPEQWQEWRRNSVTTAVMELIKERIEEAKDQLVGPSNDRDFDQYVKGMIKGYNELLDVQLDIFTEEDIEDEVSTRDPSPSGNY